MTPGTVEHEETVGFSADPIVTKSTGTRPPPGPWITERVVRAKNPVADLKQQYRKVFALSTVIAFVMHTAIAIAYPTFEVRRAIQKKDQIVIQMDDIPETQQIQRPPPPPRPSIPVETESEEVPDDVTIESTDLDFDDAPVDLPPPPPPDSYGEQAPEEEEIVEFWAVEKKPEPLKQAMPKYPEVARKAGLEGVVFVKFVVGTDGRVKKAMVVRGPEIFRESALEALYQFVFSPAIQNDRPVQVWMSMPIRFRLGTAN